MTPVDASERSLNCELLSAFGLKLDSLSHDTNLSPTDPLNYFNYFTEVEEEFVRRRGKPLLISPLDWALIESWKNSGIPLHIVLRAINRAFDAYEARAHRYRKINSVLYCQQEVEATFAEYRLALTGAGREAPEDSSTTETGRKDDEAFSREALLEFLSRCLSDLSEARKLATESQRQELTDALTRSLSRLDSILADAHGAERIDPEALERDLDSLERMILEGAIRSYDPKDLESIRGEARTQLRAYKKKMDKEFYEQTVENLIAGRLRELNKIPRLSLFYM